MVQGVINGKAGDVIWFAFSQRASDARNATTSVYLTKAGEPVALSAQASTNFGTGFTQRTFSRTAPTDFDGVMFYVTVPGSTPLPAGGWLEIGGVQVEYASTFPSSAGSTTRAFSGDTPPATGATGSWWTGSRGASLSVAQPTIEPAALNVPLAVTQYDEDKTTRGYELLPLGATSPVVVLAPGAVRYTPPSGTLKAIMFQDGVNRLQSITRSSAVYFEDTDNPARSRAMHVRSISVSHVPGFAKEYREVTLEWVEVA
ncbi:hypothetical protein FB00_11215 [Cellulosimicrobium funkei]|uniref:Uncharacterized protein n=2 Tax=Cellulosimicrobium funkei TaxID=264251 RepID=A0A0H2KRZ4_9MICO|nr:hypothetical protein FB00_11215 [Cellulosimicrobium funkei]